LCRTKKIVNLAFASEMNEKGREISSEMKDVLDIPFAHFEL